MSAHTDKLQCPTCPGRYDAQVQTDAPRKVEVDLLGEKKELAVSKPFAALYAIHVTSANGSSSRVKINSLAPIPTPHELAPDRFVSRLPFLQSCELSCELEM